MNENFGLRFCSVLNHVFGGGSCKSLCRLVVLILNSLAKRRSSHNLSFGLIMLVEASYDITYAPHPITVNGSLCVHEHLSASLSSLSTMFRMSSQESSSMLTMSASAHH